MTALTGLVISDEEQYVPAVLAKRPLHADTVQRLASHVQQSTSVQAIVNAVTHVDMPIWQSILRQAPNHVAIRQNAVNKSQHIDVFALMQELDQCWRLSSNDRVAIILSVATVSEQLTPVAMARLIDDLTTPATEINAAMVSGILAIPTMRFIPSRVVLERLIPQADHDAVLRINQQVHCDDAMRIMLIEKTFTEAGVRIILNQVESLDRAQWLVIKRLWSQNHALIELAMTKLTSQARFRIIQDEEEPLWVRNVLRLNQHARIDGVYNQEDDHEEDYVHDPEEDDHEENYVHEQEEDDREEDYVHEQEEDGHEEASVYDQEEDTDADEADRHTTVPPLSWAAKIRITNVIDQFINHFTILQSKYPDVDVGGLTRLLQTHSTHFLTGEINLDEYKIRCRESLDEHREGLSHAFIRDLTLLEHVSEAFRAFFNVLDKVITWAGGFKHTMESTYTPGAREMFGRDHFFKKPNLESDLSKAISAFENTLEMLGQDIPQQGNAPE
jgi:hypothetical protein